MGQINLPTPTPEPAHKPGYKTTEFYVALYVAVSPVLTQYLGIHLPGAEIVGQFVAAAAYIYGRSIVKSTR